MSSDAEREQQVFMQVHRGLPRQGPGSRACTRRALERVGPLLGDPRVLDIACGPGMQTMDLAALLPRATITAVDMLPEFVQEARGRAEARGVADRVKVLPADMRELPFEPGSFDLIWCEGAAYIMGVPQALGAWAPLLREQGRIALTEVAWLTPERPPLLQKYWEEAYPPMTDVAGCREHIESAGLQPIADFVLPASAWWDDYYRPLEERVDQLTEALAGDAVAKRVLASYREELAMFRDYGEYYGYVFLVMKRG